jgi:hypothetical protein
MPNYLHGIKSFLQNLLHMPARVDRLARIVKSMENTVTSLLYLHTLERLHPEVADKLIARQAELPESLLEEIEGWYGAREPVNTVRNMRAQVIADIATRMVSSLSPEAMTSLFLEATALAGNNKKYILKLFIEHINNYIMEDSLLLSALREFECLHGIWEKGFERTWALYISVLLRIGDTDKALAFVKRHAAVYSLANLGQTLPAAHFAHNKGFSNKLIAAAAWLVDEVKKNDKSDSLTNRLRNKRVAVVGNGPFEMGKGLGETIDAYDTVVRFNQAVVLDKNVYKRDYGCKTDIAAVNAGPMDYSGIAENMVFFFFESLFRHGYSAYTIQLLAKAARKKHCVLAAMPLSTYKNLTKNLGIMNPSSGLVVAAYVKTLNPLFSRDDIFGFSHKQPDSSAHFWEGSQIYYYMSNYESRKNPTMHIHSLKKERQIFRSLFN